MAALCVLLAGLSGSAVEVEVTFNGDIAPILYAKCMPCHAPGGEGPFPLVTYDEVRRRSQLVRQVALIGTMPPTDAQSDLGRLVRHAPLNDDEAIALQHWIRDGLKEGEGIAPPLQAAPDAWNPRAFDQVVRPQGPVKVPADGPVYRRLLRIPLNLPGPRTLAAFDIRPASRGVVRCIRIAIEGDTKKPPFEAGEADRTRLIGSWSPGYYPWCLPPRSGIVLARSTALIAEVVYQPSGKPEDGSLELGLTFAEEGASQLQMVTLGRKEFEIPRSSYTELVSETTLSEDVEVVAIFPEARQFGKQVRVTAHVPGQPPRTLMLILSYDPNWLGSYVFQSPVRLPKGTRLVGSIQYDNVEHANDRTKGRTVIRAGKGERDELFWIHLQCVRVGGA